jgi:hypothetical protein
MRASSKRRKLANSSGSCQPAKGAAWSSAHPKDLVPNTPVRVGHGLKAEFNGTTHPSTAVGLIWPNPSLALSPPNALTAGHLGYDGKTIYIKFESIQADAAFRLALDFERHPRYG